MSRVNLQYSIDISELPSEVQRLIDKASDHLYQSYEMTDQFKHNEEIFSIDTIQKLDKIRQSLASVDQTIADTQSIVRGFISFLTETQAQPEADMYDTAEVPPDNSNRMVIPDEESSEE